MSKEEDDLKNTLAILNARVLLAKPRKGAHLTPKLTKSIVPTNVYKKLVKDKSTKEIIGQKYVSESHEKYCKTKEFSLLTQPFTHVSASTLIPIKRFNIGSIFSLDEKPLFEEIKEGNYLLEFSAGMNNYNIHFLNESSVNNNVSVDVSWISAQKAYIESLSTYDLYTLHGYSYKGDRLVNRYLQGLDTYDGEDIGVTQNFGLIPLFPVYFQAESVINKLILEDVDISKIFKINNLKELIKISSRYTKLSTNIPRTRKLDRLWLFVKFNWKNFHHSEKYIIIIHLWKHLQLDVIGKVILKFAFDLDRIIKNAPVIKQDTVVYRGVSNDYYLSGSKNNFYQNVGFVSTTLDIFTAKTFTHEKCCIQHITLKKGTHALLMMSTSLFPPEKEILLSHGCTYYIKTPVSKKYFHKDPFDNEFEICYDNMEEKFVSEIVLMSQNNLKKAQKLLT